MVKPGYKQTEVGIIPENWDVKTLKAVAPLQRGFDLPYSSIQEGKYPVVFSNGVGAFHNSYMVKGPGVITGRSGTIGKIHYVESNYWPHNTTLWVTDFNNNDPLYVYYLFKNIPWAIFNSGSGVPTLNRNDIHDYLVAIPPQIEQEKISTMLADADSLIGSLEKQLVKKKAIKQGAMQELLAGKKRLPGFSGEWQRVRIGSMTAVFSGGTPNTSEPLFWGGTIPWMNSGELNLKIVSQVQGRITKAGMDSSSTHFVPAECVLIGLAGQGKTRGTAAFNTFPLCTNQSIVAIYPNPEKFNSKFLYYKMDTQYEKLRELSSGDGGRGGLNKKLILDYEVAIPKSVDEQAAIANVLTEMDDEIENTEKKLAKYRQVKQGMMQQLLTGNIRLV